MGLNRLEQSRDPSSENKMREISAIERNRNEAIRSGGRKGALPRRNETTTTPNRTLPILRLRPIPKKLPVDTKFLRRGYFKKSSRFSFSPFPPSLRYLSNHRLRLYFFRPFCSRESTVGHRRATWTHKKFNSFKFGPGFHRACRRKFENNFQFEKPNYSTLRKFLGL